MRDRARSILCVVLVPAIVAVLWIHAQYSNASMERAVRLVTRGDIKLILSRISAEQAALDAVAEADRIASGGTAAGATAKADAEPVSLVNPDDFAP